MSEPFKIKKIYCTACAYNDAILIKHALLTILPCCSLVLNQGDIYGLTGNLQIFVNPNVNSDNTSFLGSFETHFPL